MCDLRISMKIYLINNVPKPEALTIGRMTPSDKCWCTHNCVRNTTFFDPSEQERCVALFQYNRKLTLCITIIIQINNLVCIISKIIGFYLLIYLTTELLSIRPSMYTYSFIIWCYYIGLIFHVIIIYLEKQQLSTIQYI